MKDTLSAVKNASDRDPKLMAMKGLVCPPIESDGFGDTTQHSPRAPSTTPRVFTLDT